MFKSNQNKRIQCKQILLFLTFVHFFAFTSIAQKIEKPLDVFEIHFGYAFNNDLVKLNSNFSDLSLSQINEDFFGVIFTSSILRFYPKDLYSSIQFAVEQSQNNTDSSFSSLTFSNLTVNLNYRIKFNKLFCLTPFLGFGGTITAYEYSNVKGLTSMSFESAINLNDNTYIKIEQSGKALILIGLKPEVIVKEKYSFSLLYQYRINIGKVINSYFGGSQVKITDFPALSSNKMFIGFGLSFYIQGKEQE